MSKPGSSSEIEKRFAYKLERYAVPESLDDVTSAEVSALVGYLMNASVGFEKPGSRFLNEVVEADDRDEVESMVAQLIERWADALEEQHGADGLGLVARWAEDRGYVFERGVAKGSVLSSDAKIVARRQAEANAYRAEELAERAAHAQALMNANEPTERVEHVELEKEGDLIVKARIRADWDGEDADILLGALLRNPKAKKLRNLVLGVWSTEENYYYDATATIVETGPHPALEELTIGDYDADEMEISWTEVGNLSALWRQLPSLKRMRVRGGGIQLGTLVHQELRELVLESGGLGAEPVRAIAALRCPKLAKLEVWFGDSSYGAEGTIEMLRPLLEREDLSELRHLHLRNAEFTDAIAEALPAAPFACQLETLDLSLGTLTREGAEKLAVARRAFGALVRLDIRENFVDSVGVTALREAFGDRLAFGGQEASDVDLDGTAHRYVSVGE